MLDRLAPYHLHSMFKRSQCEHVGLSSSHLTFRCLRGNSQHVQEFIVKQPLGRVTGGGG
jgi:hypothetical protein